MWQLFDPALPIESHLDSTSKPWHLRAEVVPEDQRELEVEGHLHVHCIQVQDKDGNDRYTTDVVLQGFNSNRTLLDGRRDGDLAAQDENRAR